MKLLLALPLLLTASVLAQTKEPTPAQKAAQASVHHEANFDADRKRALELSRAHQEIQALTLCTELVRQDPADGLLAECRGRALMVRAGGEVGTPAYQRDHDEGLAEFKRALALGDDTNFVQAMIDLMSGKIGGSSPGYQETKVPAAQAAIKEGEVAFTAKDNKAAFAAYVKASDADPTYYTAKLFAGDACFQSGDLTCAGEWFAKAISLDPNRETAYRYWGDALYKAGKSHEAKEKFEQAIIAEPYQRLSWNGLLQWAQLTHTQMGSITLPRPKVEGEGKINVTINPSDPPGAMMAWLVYSGCRMGDVDKDKAASKSGAKTPPYSAELETKCLDLAASTVIDAKTKDSDLTPSLRALLALKKDGMIECWVRINSGDAGAAQGYAAYRDAHRDLLIAYLDKYVVHEGTRSTQSPRLSGTDGPAR